MHNDVLGVLTVHAKSATAAVREQAVDAEEAMLFVEVVKKFSPNIRKEILFAGFGRNS